MKRVLVISYYWPPKAGAGVFRWLQITKYFSENNWHPIVYTPENGEVPIFDETLINDVSDEVEVIKSKIWEPFDLYKNIFSKKNVEVGFLQEKKESKNGSLELAKWIRGNFFIPDSRRFWIKPSVKYLCQYLKENPVDAIISTGPPHTCHLIALNIKRKLGIPWIADFRDPWTGIDFNEDLKITKWAFKRHRKLELNVLNNANRVTTISSGMAEEFKELHDREYDCIPNGFDPEDYTNLNEVDKSKFLISYMGTANKARNPYTLWKVLGDLIKTNPAFKQALKIRFVGKIDYSVNESILENALQNHFQHIGHMEHKKAINLAGEATLLLLLINNAPNAKGILTGKMFEYFGISRTVLCVGPKDGNAAEIIKNANVGFTVSPNDYDETRRVIEDLFEQYQNGMIYKRKSEVDQYSRRRQSHDFTNILEELSKDEQSF